MDDREWEKSMSNFFQMPLTTLSLSHTHTHTQRRNPSKDDLGKQQKKTMMAANRVQRKNKNWKKK